MNLLDRKAWSKCLILVFVGVISMSMMAQTTIKNPGGVSGASFWSYDGDSSALIANYHTLDLLDVESSAIGAIPKMEGATTFFLVLKPSFTTATGAQFLELGDISIYDNRIDHGSTSTPLDFSDGDPKILTLTMQRSPRFKTSNTPQIQLKDSSLFSLAELIYYPHLKSRGQIRMVNTYLAIKYSVPITDIPEKQWRDYLAADSSTYWDFTTDKLYGKRVLGVGKSSSQDLFQSQTQTSHGSFLKLSLDTVKVQGAMSGAVIDENAFLIFSERAPEKLSSVVFCKNNGQNPLKNWKLKPHKWSGESKRLFIELEKPKGLIADSIWLTDGFSYTYVPQMKNTPTALTYGVTLDSLVNGLHYFFTSEKGNPCDELEITVAQNVLTVGGPALTGGGFSLRTHSYSTGLTIEEPLESSSSQRSLPKGQYQVTVLDPDQTTVLERVILVKSDVSSDLVRKSESKPRLLVTPNPALVGNTAVLTINDFPTGEYLLIQVADASGKVLLQKEEPYENGQQVAIEAPLPGLYTIRVIQGGVSYSIKMLVAAH